MSEPLFEARGVAFSYGLAPLLAGIDLTVNRGEIVGLVGADGAGKSTLLRLAVGQLTPERGSLQVLGQPPGAPALRDDIAYMPQGFGLYQDLSVRENLDFFADLHGLGAGRAAKRIADLLRRTGLAGFEGRRAGALSGGMMQKLALACAMVSAPRVMFLDEPTTGVDPLSRRSFWELLKGISGEGVGILYATANMDEAERCDRVAVLEGGTLTRQGTPLELAEQAGALVAVRGPEVRRLRDRVRSLEGVELVFPVGSRLNVWMRSGSSAEHLQAQLDSITPGLQAEAMQPTLHDAALRELALAHGSDQG